MTRHPEARAFLAAHLDADVAARALERIAAHDETLDESYRWMSVSTLVRELAAEPVDTIAWGSLLASRVQADHGDTAHGQRAIALLAATAQRAAAADALVGELRRLLLDEAGTEAA